MGLSKKHESKNVQHSYDQENYYIMVLISASTSKLDIILPYFDVIKTRNEGSSAKLKSSLVWFYIHYTILKDLIWFTQPKLFKSELDSKWAYQPN